MRQSFEVGNFSFEYDSGDLFRLSWQGTEIIQRAYVGVRDENWNTIPAKISNLLITHDKDSTSITFWAIHKYQNIDFSWSGEIVVNIYDDFYFKMNGKVESDFTYCKIGFNIHHGLTSYRNLEFTAQTIDQDYRSTFEEDLIPQLVRNHVLTAMTPHYDKLKIQFPTFDATFEFLGDRFEMQDHRNWSDANWKSYGTPLEKGFPFYAISGQVIDQEIRLTITNSQKSLSSSIPKSPPKIRQGILPAIGFLMLEIPTDAQLLNLKQLKPNHLRINLLSSSPDFEFLTLALGVANEVGAKLEIGLFLNSQIQQNELTQLLVPLVQNSQHIVRILVLTEKTGYSAFQGASAPGLSAMVKKLVPKEIEIFSGTDQFFSDINREMPNYSEIDGLVFALNPQVHASDDLSVMQNASPIEDIAAYIRRKYDDPLISLSTVDLIGAGGPFPNGLAPRNGLAPYEDLRQQNSFGAAWTLAMIAHATVAKIHAITFYEIAGNRGVMDLAGKPFPVFVLLREIARLAESGFKLTGVQGSSDQDSIAMKFSGGVRNVYLVANLCDSKKSLTNWGEFVMSLEPYEVRLSVSI